MSIAHVQIIHAITAGWLAIDITKERNGWGNKGNRTNEIIFISERNEELLSLPLRFIYLQAPWLRDSRPCMQSRSSS
jgi:hypothetical protein